MTTLTLVLWVANQGASANADHTFVYLESAGWNPPAPIVLDRDRQTLFGPARACYLAYLDLRKVLARLGNQDARSILSAPMLTACPAPLIERYGDGSAAVALARYLSLECHDWQAYQRQLSWLPGGTLPRAS